ncbi:MAG: hypothetical protein HQ541_12285, partial [Mariniphaga sp.]|nr:hypothetical protein [Mariniphaga sp.]
EKEGINPNEIFRAIKVLALQLKKLLLCNADAYTFFTEIWNSKYGVNFNSFSLEIDHLKKIKSFDINESLEVCERILEDFFIKITEIENYSLSGYKPRSSETNPDIIL